MTRPESVRLELLAEVDALVERLERWAADAPKWEPAETCRALVRRFRGRADSLNVRLEAPLVVAMLGGTGTGKSALVNALLGAEIVRTGRQRPTTTRPTLICRPDLTPEMLGIQPGTVELVRRDLPALAELVLIDCPDPDTTEETAEQLAAEQVADGSSGGGEDGAAYTAAPGTNLARLRQILPQCDVLLVTTTQQKYRSARVADELAAVASGARLVFVQTHADCDEDVREDWSDVLGRQYATGHVFLVDSPAALADARNGLQPRGEFAGLVDLLTRQLAGAAGNRIRRANFLDLAEDLLDRCRRRIDKELPAVRRLSAAIDEQRVKLADLLSRQTRGELLASRRPWENRLLGRIASRWGLSPFALVLRIFQALGGLLAARLLWRARTPAQVALWGALEGARTWRKRREQREADQGADRAVAGCWDQAELRSAALILAGYAAEAGLPREHAHPETITAEADRAAAGFVAGVMADLESVIARLAQRHTGWLTRFRYELLLAGMLGLLLYRLGRNFFYDSWLAPEEVRVDVYGLDFYVSAGFWLVLWCLVLIWLFSGRLRRGLRREIDQLADGWKSPVSAAAVFARLEDGCRRVEQFRQDLDGMQQRVARLRSQLALPEEQLGHKLGERRRAV
jgi:hypothetical protein